VIMSEMDLEDGLLVYKKLMNFWDGVVLKRMSLLKKLM